MTRAPCYGCSKAIRAAGIKETKYPGDHYIDTEIYVALGHHPDDEQKALL